MAEKVLGFRIEVRGTDKETSELVKLGSQIDKLRDRIKELNKIRRTEGRLTRAQSKEREKLKTQLKANTSQYNALNKQILINNGVIKKSTGLFGGFKKAIVSSALSIIGWTAAITGVISILKGGFKVISDFDESVANLAKTTGLAKDEARLLAREVIKIDTRTSVTALLELATAGGRLGLEGQNLIDFTREADKAFVSLGDSLEGSAEDIALTLGKLAASFGIEEEFGIGESLNKIGSVVNELGATTKASEGPIIAFTKRLAGVASQAGITLPEIAALGALFDANGQSMEIAATTFQKLLPAIGKDVEKFAKVAGLNIDEFSALLRDKPFEALVAVADGAKSTESGLIGLTETLQNFGIDSGRAAGIVTLLSENTEELAEIQLIANTAFEEGTSLSAEFALKNDTLAANTEKLGNSYDKFIISLLEGNGIMSNTISLFVKGGASVLDFISDLADGEGIMESFNTLARKQLVAVGALTQEQADLGNAIINNEGIIKVLNERLESGEITLESYNKALKKLSDGWEFSGEASEESSKKQKESTEEITDSAVKAAKTVSDINKKASDKAKKQKEKDDADAIKLEEKLQNDLTKLRIDAIENDRDRESSALANKFDERIKKARGDSETETELELELKAAKQKAIDKQQAGFDLEDRVSKEEKRALELENQLILTEEDLEARRLVLEQQRLLELSEKDLTESEINVINKKFDDIEISDDEKLALIKHNQRQAELAAIAGGLNAISGLLKDGSTEAKLLASGAALVNTYAAAAAALAAPPIGAGPLLGPILAGTAIASGLANVARINSVSFADGGLVEGASHDQGGIQMYQKGGQHLGEMEGNEYIISKKRVQEIGKDNLDAINFNGMSPSTNGFFAHGGQVPSFNGGSSSSSVISNNRDMADLIGRIIAEQMQEAIIRTPVINNAVDTFTTAADVVNTENDLSFG